jgi:hypothetical protein
VEQTIVSELADMELPAEVYGGPTSAAVERDHATSLQAECRLGGTWAKRPQKDLERLSCLSSLPSWHEWHHPTGWCHT